MFLIQFTNDVQATFSSHTLFLAKILVPLLSPFFAFYIKEGNEDGKEKRKKKSD